MAWRVRGWNAGAGSGSERQDLTEHNPQMDRNRGCGQEGMMQRIRTIKPDFFLSDDVLALSFPARLLFIGLWTCADREGRLEDRPAFLKRVLLPDDPVEID